MSLSSRFLTVLLFSLLAPIALAQSGKAFLKEAEKLRAEQQLEPALEKYGLAIAVDPALLKAYQGRAEVLTLLGRKTEAARDLGKAAQLDPGETRYAAAAANAYMEIDSAAKAVAFCDQALRVDPKYLEALMAKTRACLALKELDCASASADAALAVKGTTDTYYLHGLVRTATKDYKTAEFDLDKVLEWNHLYEPAYIALSEVQLLLYEQYSGATMQMRTLEKAIDKCTRALELNQQSTDALFVRSKALALQKEYAKAIDDISRCIALGRNDRDVFLQRAKYYHGYNQHQNAVNDLNKVVLNQPKDVEALLLRAECKEANVDMEGALKDLDLATKAMEGDPAYGPEKRKTIEGSRTRIAQQVFEMNREGDQPIITVIEPYRVGDAAQVSTALAYVKVSGYVRDKSLLKTITVNGGAADFTKDEKDPQFVVSVPLSPSQSEIVVQAIDVYDNMSSQVLRVERTEGIAPSVEIVSPVATGDRQVTIPAGKDDLFIEGRITDASLIRLVAVNGVNASYAPDRIDPDFSIKVDLKDKERFVVRVEDQFGNATEAIYSVIRKAEPVAAVKPTPAPTTTEHPTSSSTTGSTWVIFIENTNYRSLPALQSSAADQAKMQKAFANYSIGRTINKKNLTKEQLERFFNIELRDLVRTNKVNTILVWYSGHGRTVGGKAYWVPVDGRKDDIYSFFNYGSLKAQMQNYSESVNNTVVVSDAAGGDASFYELTR